MTNYSYKTILTKFSDENKDLIIKLFKDLLKQSQNILYLENQK